MHCLYCGTNLSHYVILNDKCPGCHSSTLHNTIYSSKESDNLESLKELMQTTMNTEQINTIFEDPIKTAAAAAFMDIFSETMKHVDRITPDKDSIKTATDAAFIDTFSETMNAVDALPTSKHIMKCYHCQQELTHYSSLNDGGTIICSSCHRYFHPEQNGIPAHPHENAGPLSCEICNPI